MITRRQFLAGLGGEVTEATVEGVVAVGDDVGPDVHAGLGQGGAEALGLGDGDQAVHVAVHVPNGDQPSRDLAW